MNSSFPKKIGILGGGQLARMLALSCYQLGLTPYIYCKSKTDSAAQVVSEIFHDNGRVDSVLDFASRVDLVILESEFFDIELLKSIEKIKPLWPRTDSLQLVQNKLHQKQNLEKLDLPTSDFLEVSRTQDLVDAVKKLGSKIVLKSATRGYDGKGVIFYDSNKTKPELFFNQNPLFNGYAEKFVPFKKEIAVVCTRDLSGDVECFPVVETYQSQGICEWVVKADLNHSIAKKINLIAKKIMKGFDAVGTFGVEMFLDKKNNILINEIAPRVHNSGHITMDACNVSQFEQHLRAVAGLEMVKPRWIFQGAAMVNIITKSEKIDRSLEFDFTTLNSQTKLYWYGKKPNVIRRKVGHINIVGSKTSECLKQGLKVRAELKV